jgi:23S rRNA (adenine2030-N6)-methyltransferase
MNYGHHYHAGNAADVLKHVVLVALLQALSKKDKPFCYLDTHAGMAVYDLKAQATAEYQQGISKLFNQKPESALLQSYLQCVSALNPNGKLQHYPGSPAIAKSFLRPQDKMILNELQTDTHALLKKYFTHQNQINVHHQDGYQALKAFLPPVERRGLVLIDPAYENADEWNVLVKKLKDAYERWPTGIYAIWYPIKTRRQVDRFHQQLSASNIDNLFVVELCPYPTDIAQRLNGSGLVIVNLPWQLDIELQTMLPELLNYLKQNDGAYTQAFLLT